MKATITSGGVLNIERIGTLKECFCPFEPNAEASTVCGDWCPLFGEPSIQSKQVILQLCHKTLYLESIADLRKEVG